MIQRTCYFQTACYFGRKNRKAQPVLESKIRAGIKTIITVRLVTGGPILPCVINLLRYIFYI
jgi:hypothetical protein